MGDKRPRPRCHHWGFSSLTWDFRVVLSCPHFEPVRATRPLSGLVLTATDEIEG